MNYSDKLERHMRIQKSQEWLCPICSKSKKAPHFLSSCKMRDLIGDHNHTVPGVTSGGKEERKCSVHGKISQFKIPTGLSRTQRTVHG